MKELKISLRIKIWDSVLCCSVRAADAFNYVSSTQVFSLSSSNGLNEYYKK